MIRLIAWRSGPQGFSRWHVQDEAETRRTACGITIPDQAITSHLITETRPQQMCTACWPVPKPVAPEAVAA